MTTTEAIRVDRPGGPEKLVLRTIELAEPAASEIRVRVAAAGVAFADIMVREGRYPGVKTPVTPGYDLVGTIEAVGSAVTHLHVGQRVGALTVSGAYARHAVIPAAWAIPIPLELDAALAVSLVLNYVTAWQMLTRNTTLQRGDVALVHGAAGGVGLALLELCRMRGIRTIGTASRAKHAAVIALGGTPIDYRAEDFVPRVRALTGGLGADAAFDHLGSTNVKRSYDALRATGVVVSYGAMSAFKNGRTNVSGAVRLLLREPRFRPLQLLGDNKAVVGFDIAGRRRARPDWFDADLTALVELLSAGTIVPTIAARFPLADARAAQRMLGEKPPSGKIVLICD